MMCVMDENPTISTQDLATIAARAFSADHGVNVPEKIWADSYQGTPYVRAAWADGLTAARIDGLKSLQEALERTYGLPWVAVAYSRDMTWKAVDRLAARLQAVR